MDTLKLTIKPKEKYSDETKSIARSAGYDCVIGDWKLGKGVKKFTLEMDAGEKPKLIVEATVDHLDIDSIRGLDLCLIDIETGSKGLTFDQAVELADYRKMKRQKERVRALESENKRMLKEIKYLQGFFIGFATLFLLLIAIYLLL